MSEISKTIDVPARGRKWVTGAIVRDATDTLYRVVGAPIRYHEDCLPMQRVREVRVPPADWVAVARLLAIMELLRATGTPTSERSVRPAAPYPTDATGEALKWEARREANSYAAFPRIDVRGDVLRYVEPIYDDEPIITWLRDSALADEARALIAQNPSLSRYPSALVRHGK